MAATVIFFEESRSPPALITRGLCAVFSQFKCGLPSHNIQIQQKQNIPAQQMVDALRGIAIHRQQWRMG